MMAFAIVSILCAGAMLGAGYWAIDRWAPQWGFSPLLLSVAVNLVAGWIAFAVIEVVRRRRPDYLPQAAMGAMVIRILPAGAITLGVMILGVWNSLAVSVCMLVSYLVFLAVETVFVVRLMARTRFADNARGEGELASS